VEHKPRFLFFKEQGLGFILSRASNRKGLEDEPWIKGIRGRVQR